MRVVSVNTAVQKKPIYHWHGNQVFRYRDLFYTAARRTVDVAGAKLGGLKDFFFNLCASFEHHWLSFVSICCWKSHPDGQEYRQRRLNFTNVSEPAPGPPKNATLTSASSNHTATSEVQGGKPRWKNDVPKRILVVTITLSSLSVSPTRCSDHATSC